MAYRVTNSTQAQEQQNGRFGEYARTSAVRVLILSRGRPGPGLIKQIIKKIFYGSYKTMKLF